MSATIDNSKFVKTTLIDYPFEPQTFDIVLGLNILHLLGDYQESVERSFELLKPGGVFISSTACIANHPGSLKYFLPIVAALRISPYVKIFDLTTLKGKMTRVGFEILEWGALGSVADCFGMAKQRPAIIDGFEGRGLPGGGTSLLR